MRRGCRLRVESTIIILCGSNLGENNITSLNTKYKTCISGAFFMVASYGIMYHQYFLVKGEGKIAPRYKCYKIYSQYVCNRIA